MTQQSRPELHARQGDRHGWLTALTLATVMTTLAGAAVVLHAIERHLLASSGTALALAATDIADKIDLVLYARSGDLQALSKASAPLLARGNRMALASLLAAVQQAHPLYLWVGVTDATGRILAATDDVSVGQDRSRAPWFLAVREGASLDVRDPTGDEETHGVWTIAYSAPIVSAGDRFIGVATMRVSLAQLSDLFARTLRPFLSARELAGNIEWEFLRRDGAVLNESLPQAQAAVNLLDLGVSSARLSLAPNSLPGFIEEQHGRRGGAIITGYAHTQGYGRFASPLLGVLVRMDRSDLLAPTRTIMWQAGAVWVVFILPLLALTTRSTRQLHQAWRQASAAETEVRRLNADLDQRVAARTEQIEAANRELETEVIHRRMAEEAVRRSEARFRSLIENATDMIMVLDPRGTILFVSPSITRIIGYTAEERIGRSALEYLHPDDVLAARVALARALAEPGVTHTFEARVRAKDGTWHVLDARGRLVAAGESLTGVVINLRDITEMKRAQEGLILFRLLLDHTNDAIEVIDPDTGRFLDVNEQACRVHGFTREEYLALTVPEIDPLVGAQPWAETRENVQRVEFRVIETQHRRKDGSVFPVEVNVTYVRLERDYMLAIVRDLTDRHRLEARLRQAQKMETLGQLTGGIAHDFNNLLLVINGYCQLLLDQLRHDDPLYTDLQQVRLAGERAATLTRQLLAFSRRQPMKLEALDLTVIVAGLESMLRRLLTENIHLMVEPGPSPATIRADRGQIEQVILNLVLNARDAMPQGGTLTVETCLIEEMRDWPIGEAVRPTGRYVQLTVTDTGCGMDAETLHHAFEPFFTTKEPGKGTGLGLATVYGIVKQIGGFVTVESEVGRGSRFCLTLPLATAPHEAEHSLSPVRVETAVRRATLLLVEDDDGVRELVTRMLTLLGYHVVAAASGPEALRLAAQHPERLSLLLTDVIMQGMSGPELARHLVDRDPMLKVIFMSAYPGQGLTRYGIVETETAFLPKPFSLEMLAQAVRDALGFHPNEPGPAADR